MDLFIAGIHMTRFGKRPGDSVKDLTREAVEGALADAGAAPGDIEAAWFSNTRQPMLEGQNTIRGQIALRALGIQGVPIVNVENACASGSTAVRQAISYLRAGEGDIVLAVGADKMFFADRPEQVAAAFLGGTDVHEIEWTKNFVRGLGGDVDDASNGQRSIFMDLYAAQANAHAKRWGTTQEDFARLAAKNHTHSQYNPNAQYQTPMTLEQVMADRPIAFPLTRAMCAPVSDGAAAAVIVNRKGLEKLGAAARAVRIRGCALRSGLDHPYEDAENSIGRRTALAAYAESGVDPADVDVAEVHDATSYAELAQIECLGLAPFGGVPAALREGAFALGGRTPVNTSGGLVSKGHPVGATGLGQMYEIATQLRGEAGGRQVEGAKIGVAENGGGFLLGEEGACVVTVLEAPGV